MDWHARPVGGALQVRLDCISNFHPCWLTLCRACECESHCFGLPINSKFPEFCFPGSLQTQSSFPVAGAAPQPLPMALESPSWRQRLVVELEPLNLPPLARSTLLAASVTTVTMVNFQLPAKHIQAALSHSVATHKRYSDCSKCKPSQLQAGLK